MGNCQSNEKKHQIAGIFFVRLNLLRLGRATAQGLWMTRHCSSRHFLTKWSRKWPCG